MKFFGYSTGLDIPDDNGSVGGTGEGTPVWRIGEWTGELGGGFGGFEGGEQFECERVPDLHNFFGLSGDEMTAR